MCKRPKQPSSLT
jgi:hypothetical protein